MAKLAAIEPQSVVTPAALCGGVTSVSLASRAVGVLKPDEACALRRGDVFKECADCTAMVVVPAGSFTMGSPASEPERRDDEGPQHVVTFPKAFAVGKYDVTRDEFAAFDRETGYDAGSKCWSYRENKREEVSGHSWRDPGFPQTGFHPVVCVNWSDAQAYVKWLSEKTQQTYRLLSESKWEYASRGQTSPGSYPRYFFGDSEDDFCKYGNGAGQTAKSQIPGANGWTVLPCSDGYAYTSPVGVSNPFGLYDMHGNVWQWTRDCYDKDRDGRASGDGLPIESGECSRRAVRGGSRVNEPRLLRAAQRSRFNPSDRSNCLGFRVARTLLP